MNHQDHVNLIKGAEPAPGGIWADLGAGEGAFTLALADITHSQAEIYSIDTDDVALDIQNEMFERHFPNAKVHYIVQDFTQPLHVPKLDGILMANALHYIENQVEFLKSLHQYLKPNAKIILVEYNTLIGNHWVPFPISYKTFEKIAEEAGFKNVRQTGTIASHFLNEIYAAVADN